ncbi:MAG: hypothetical protein QW783_03885 [Candidatus Micrarchaeia archaeon]
MVYEKFQIQKEIRKKNEEKILSELNESPKRFKDLQNKLNFSPMGLKKILSRLKEEQEIEKVMYQGHEAYSITKKGINELNQLWHIYHELDYLRENKASYAHTIINSFISLDMIISKEAKNSISSYLNTILLIIRNIISKEAKNSTLLIPNVPEFNNFITENVFKNVKEGNLNVESSDGKIMLSFEFDLKRMSSFFNETKIFIEDIKEGLDVLNDDRIDIMKIQKEDRASVINKLILNSLYFVTDDKNFNEKLVKFSQSFNDNKKVKDIFGGDFKILNRIIDDIKRDKDPLEDKKISNQLIIKKGNVTYFPISNYLELAMLINVDNKVIWDKINKYAESLEIWFENGETKLRLKSEVKQ